MALVLTLLSQLPLLSSRLSVYSIRARLPFIFVFRAMENQMINILLVEDDQVDVMNVQRAFKRGHITNSLYVAENGLEGLEMLRGTADQPPVVPRDRRLILLDLNMPKMNGIEFLQALRADPALKYIPVVVLTTSNEDQDRVNAYNLNVAGYLLKPVTFSTFVEVMVTLNKYWTLCEMP
jgi:CheY-like chemotaxis protein